MVASTALTVVVVGASSEIGSSISRALADDGFRVVTTQRQPPPADALDDDDRPTAFQLDVTAPESVRSCFAAIEATWGPPFGLVYVAGRAKDAPLMLLSDAAWREVIDVNLTGAFSCVRAAARPMMVAGQGRIVLVGSVSARVSAPGQAAYSASKAGLEALARAAALELGRFGVSCNVVAPGPIDSGIFRSVQDAHVRRIVQRTMLRRLGAPTEIAAAVRFLLQPDTSYMTGQTLVMDGGISAS